MIERRFCSFLVASSYCFVILACVFLYKLGMEGLGPIDDHQFIRTVFQGKDFGSYILPELGRFLPFTAQEYVFISKFIGPSPFLFHFCGAVKILLVGVLFFYCLCLTGIQKIFLPVFWSVGVLSIGLANSGFRLQVGEINALALILMFLISVLLSMREGLSRLTMCSLLVIGTILFSMALFYKETIFILMLVFAVAEIVRNYCQNFGVSQRYLWILLAISVAYVFFYLIWHVLYVTGSYASFQSLSLWNIFLFYARNDPFIVFIVLPFVMLRLFLIIRGYEKQSIFDSMLFSAIIFFLIYVCLGLINTYYLLPSYAFSVCGMSGLVAKICLPIRLFVSLVTFIFFINNFTIALSDMQSLKMISGNHYQFVQYLSKWLVNDPLSSSLPRAIVCAGVSPGSGVEVLVSLKTYLASLGVSEASFNVVGSEISDNINIANFYGFSSKSLNSLKRDDIVVYNPYQSHDYFPPLQSPSYEDIYRSGSSWALPRWSFFDWISHVLRHNEISRSSLLKHMRYVGYAALRVVRDVIPSKPDRLAEKPFFSLEELNFPKSMPSNKIVLVEVSVRNTGRETWPADGSIRTGMYVNFAYRWFTADNQMVLEGDRVPFPEPIRPNDVVKLILPVKAPSVKGIHKLILSPVQEGVLWFESNNEIKVDVY